jgi:hypothetical protein
MRVYKEWYQHAAGAMVGCGSAFRVNLGDMKRTFITWSLGVLALLLLFGGFGWFAFLRPMLSRLDIERDFLLHRADHHAVALACRDMMSKPEYHALIGQFPSGMINDFRRLFERSSHFGFLWRPTRL